MTQKVAVLDILNSEEVRAVVVKDNKKVTLKAGLKREISEETIVVTDGYMSYTKVSRIIKKHVSVIHATDRYVKDGFHSNSLEGFSGQRLDIRL